MDESNKPSVAAGEKQAGEPVDFVLMLPESMIPDSDVMI